METKKEIVLGYTVSLTIIPEGATEINTILRYGDVFDFIIGDGGYSRISIKNYGNYVRPQGYVNKHYNLDKPINKNTQLTLKLAVGRKLNTNKIILKPELKYFDTQGIQNTVIIPDFIIESHEDPDSLHLPLGLGLIDPKRTGNVQVVFKEFIVQKDLK